MKNKILIALITIITFLTCRYIKLFYAFVIFGKENWNVMNETFRIVLMNFSQLFIIIAVTWLMFKRSPFIILGLNKGFVSGLKLALISTLPMFIGYFFIAGKLNPGYDLSDIYIDLVSAGFMEEFIFRGFLFGVLYYYSGWGFIPAALIASLFFGAGHLYQAHDIGSAISIFVFTALGSIGLALFYIVWNSLWMPIFIHAFMDLAWDLFGIAGNAAGNTGSNIFRFITLGIAIYFTIKRIPDKKQFLKGKWWLNKDVKPVVFV